MDDHMLLEHMDTLKYWLWGFGLAMGVICGLVGVIWHQLHEKINDAKRMHEQALARQDTATAKALEKLEVSFKEANRATMQTFRDSVVTLTHSLNERLNAQSSRLTSGSARMDELQKVAADLRVRLAEEYLTVDDIRALVADLMQPLRERLALLDKRGH